MKFDAVKSALITGGSSGIGRAVAHRLASRGIRVFLVARDESRLDQAIAELEPYNIQCGRFAADVADAEQAAAAVAAAEREVGSLQLVLNAAGVVTPGYVLQCGAEDFARHMRINFMGTVHVNAAALPGMIERRAGWIANVSSVAGLKGVFGYAGYCASKFAVVGYSEALRAEMRQYRIGVSVLCPPDTRTPMLEQETPLRPVETQRLADMGNVLEPEAVADALVTGLRRGTFRIVPGLDAKIMCIADRLLPGLVDWMMERTVRKAQEQKKI